MARLTALKPKVAEMRSGRPTLTVTANVRTRGSAWQRTRQRILTRDAGICRCDKCRSTGALKLAHEVDHIVELVDGGTDDDYNLRAINVDCHKAKTAAARRRRE